MTGESDGVADTWNQDTPGWNYDYDWIANCPFPAVLPLVHWDTRVAYFVKTPSDRVTEDEIDGQQKISASADHYQLVLEEAGEFSDAPYVHPAAISFRDGIHKANWEGQYLDHQFRHVISHYLIRSFGFAVVSQRLGPRRAGHADLSQAIEGRLGRPQDHRPRSRVIQANRTLCNMLSPFALLRHRVHWVDLLAPNGQIQTLANMNKFFFGNYVIVVRRDHDGNTTKESFPREEVVEPAYPHGAQRRSESEKYEPRSGSFTVSGRARWTTNKSKSPSNGMSGVYYIYHLQF
ncbi:hypothetical protein NM208_g8214 [Fusarium decemcellulare]|uniref:Uncharacterized protein n=1 Tax=Fusarium decemcellulare TaxID=57161 RepID=A0ACC1S664_9HYPO|nr:hypothetical protein NM208_g8214 [Fusarium decemcellulare]